MNRMARLGVDVVDIEDFAETMRRSGHDFVEMVFTAKEIDYCRGRRLQHYAVRWAAKEAFYKAACPGPDRAFQCKDIEIIHDAHGAPMLHLHGPARQWTEAMGVTQVSLSHSRRTAIATVLIERRKKEKRRKTR